MTFLRIYLLSGLVFHKVVWELLKRRSPSTNQSKGSPSLRIRLIKVVKVTILIGIIVQTLLPEILPVTNDPTTLRAAGALIFTCGLLIAVMSRLQLGKNWADIETGRIVERQTVVSKGIYAYVRHPIYIGDLLLLLGLELSLNSWLWVGVGFLIPVVLWKAIREEKMLVNQLPGYEIYCSQTKRFIPFIV